MDDATEVDRLPILRVELDRRVAPNSVTAEGVRLISGPRSVALLVEIDLVRPALVLTPRDALEGEVTYVLEIDPLRDLDGNAGAGTRRVSFHTGTSLAERPPVPPPSFESVQAIFSARCATASCHGGELPVLGLDLSSAERVRATAIRVEASEVRRPVEGTAAPSALALTGLAIVEPLAPARSYLAYKILADPHVPGSPMPPIDGEGGEGGLDAAEITTLLAWIAGGALVPGPS
jgi:hypothetical protein